MVEVEVPWCCGAVFPPKTMGILFGYIASWTPWNISVMCGDGEWKRMRDPDAQCKENKEM